ncbi:MAG: hypothetical protein RML94_15735 [Bacteroidia bacterium]|nr:hypothetical protein [Bacteroidia bacterium]
MALNLIDVEKRKSYSIGQEQIIVSQSDKVKLRKKKEKKQSSTGGDKSKKILYYEFFYDPLR